MAKYVYCKNVPWKPGYREIICAENIASQIKSMADAIKTDIENEGHTPCIKLIFNKFIPDNYSKGEKK